jgi:arsenate reductase (thioredoxin)
MNDTPKILFVCEHGAAKSILAATYFNKLASEKGLKIRALARGTHPDLELSQKTVSGLLADGLSPSNERPIKLSSTDLENARQLVIFCELPIEYRSNVIVHEWQDVPPVSEDYVMARDKILENLRLLIDQMHQES